MFFKWSFKKNKSYSIYLYIHQHSLLIFIHPSIHPSTEELFFEYLCLKYCSDIVG